MSRIFRRGKTWYVDFEYKGKRYRKSLSTRSKQIAELALKDIDVKIARDRLDLGPVEKIRFDDFARKFLDWYEVQNSVRSYEDYRNLFNSTIIPHFGQCKLTDISVEMIEDYKRARSNCVSASTVNKELVALRHLMNKAILWDYLQRNPGLEVDKLRVKQRKFRFLTLQEIENVVSVCPPYAKPILLTAVHTGLRKSELFRLEWDDVDFERKLIVVSNKDDAHTKNYKIREIPITSQLLAELKKVKDESPSKSGIVFRKSDGSPHMGGLRKTLLRIIKNAGIESFTLHDLRHTFASHLVMEGVDIPTVQKLLGHSNIATTMIYAHLAPGHLRSAMDRLGRRFEAQSISAADSFDPQSGSSKPWPKT